jgi:3D (Asp-Asp-Asp) domain-containing protein
MNGMFVSFENLESFLTHRLVLVTVVACMLLAIQTNSYGLNRLDLTTRHLNNLNYAKRLAIIKANFNNRIQSNKQSRTDLTQTETQPTCSNGWYITGYYVPVESELPDAAEQIYVEREGDLSFSKKFLSETHTEGWGITRFGWALGYHTGGWHRSDRGALDADGNLLTIGAIAIDRSVIPSGAQVQISTLPNPWTSKVFNATDIGAGITGQHIDVFTGVGSTAEQETFRITSENNRVCFKSSVR